MLLPDKHIKIGESIFGLGSLLLETLQSPMTFDHLVAKIVPRFSSADWPAHHDTETVALALCFLFAIGLVDVSSEGFVFRCD